MTNLLIKLFIKDSDNVRSSKVRGRYGVLACVVGIVSNIALFVAKLLIGLFSGSISIMADAVNNLSDSASSVITLIGFKLSDMPADEEHPYGHARFEYISGLVVSFFILVIGYQFLTSSINKTIHPQPVEFSWTLAAVLAISIVVKLWQGMFNKKTGAVIGSSALAATAADSRNDAVTTAAVLAGAVIAHFTNLRLDGIMGILVALFILYSGVKLVRETVDPLIGLAPDREFVAAMQKKILTYETVLGTHDLVVHNYGPGRCFASVHVEVPANQDIMISHDVIDRIERDFAVEFQIGLVVHMDPIVTDDAQTSALRIFIENAAKQIDPALTTHDFRMVAGAPHTNLIFDVVVPPRYKMTDAELRGRFADKINNLSTTYYCVITVDRSYTSTTQTTK